MGAKKKYARGTEARALNCYIAKTQTRVEHLERSLNNARKVLELAFNLKKEKPGKTNV